ncbi:glutaminase A [Paenibacillus urinalis]|uniref:Glutaminase n=1 Tax=Paenibacillus urinalis TaxID=521520 RepID=A0AAX3MSF6_9BACL|nr:glutaminase A [Paenibacillus urinalis]WDH80450.1 glutaminase A [Paenibacillus urinalis]WDH96491.1 glutaminase A [Paenibacillus urinalis]WDI04714.1 glutaminase A [Paenibacillus urinalis]
MSNTKELDTLLQSLPSWVETSIPHASSGKVASYIPELSKAPQDALGITILAPDGQSVSAGDCSQVFTMQSISKVFTLILALMDNGEDEVFKRVGMEPTGDNFNSMLKLELVRPGIPFNPFINAGAITVTSLIHGKNMEEKSQRILNLFHSLTGKDNLAYDIDVFNSELESGDLNRSIAYFLKGNQVLIGDVDEVLDIYFRHCSILVQCADLARMGLILALDGEDPLTGTRLLPKRYVQIAKTFMTTCGMYNASGEFAIDVGLPAKSGVSGGILSLVPGRYGIGVIGPSLNDKGNSQAGVHLLEMVSKQMNWSMF